MPVHPTFYWFGWMGILINGMFPVAVVVVAGVVEQISVQILASPELDVSRIANKTGHPWAPCKTDSFDF